MDDRISIAEWTVGCCGPTDAVTAPIFDRVNSLYTDPAFTASLPPGGYLGPLGLYVVQGFCNAGEITKRLAAAGCKPAHPWLLAVLAADNPQRRIPALGHTRMTFAFGWRGRSNGLDLIGNFYVEPSGTCGLGFMEAGPNFELRPGEEVLVVPSRN